MEILNSLIMKRLIIVKSSWTLYSLNISIQGIITVKNRPQFINWPCILTLVSNTRVDSSQASLSQKSCHLLWIYPSIHISFWYFVRSGERKQKVLQKGWKEICPNFVLEHISCGWQTFSEPLTSDDTFFRPVMEQKSMCFVRTIVYHRTY